MSSLRDAIEFVLLFYEQPTLFLQDQWASHPYHIVIEVLFLCGLLYFYMVPLRKAKRVPLEKLTPKEEEQMLNEFCSQPFRCTTPDSTMALVTTDTSVEVHARSGAYSVVSGPNFKKPTECLDLVSFDVFGYSTNKEITELAKKMVVAYGVGSCGPRGFYGSSKPHLDLENHIARFLGVDSCIIYSFSFAAVSTIIPCYSSRGDYILMDDASCLPIQEGCYLSRSNVTQFRHNDLVHLEELMLDVIRKDKKQKKLSRRFVVTEGVFRNTGEIVPLREVLDLCKRHKFRLVLEDSYGFGVLGATGRGTPEHFGINPSEVDIYIGSMSVALGTVGGFCAGENCMIDHQRLAATGYVFSASLPPYMTGVASKALQLIDENPSSVLKLQQNAKVFRSELRQSNLGKHAVLLEASQDASPVIHIRVTPDYVREQGRANTEERLSRIVAALQVQNTLVQRSIYTFEERVENHPSLRVVIKSSMSQSDVEKSAKQIAAAIRQGL